MKATNPQLTEAFLRSDNAGCYHCAFLLLSLPNIGQNAGINISRYDFSEPQAGKDICDRRTAAVKSHMRRYINEGHDIKTAGDMKAAIESHEGVKGCYAAVCKVQETSQTMKKHSMTGIQALNNFSYEAGGLRVWRAYNIGPGKCFSPAQLARFGTPQGPTNMVTVQSFSSPSMTVGAFTASSVPPRRAAREQPGPSQQEPDQPDHGREDVHFACPEEGCIKVYQSYYNLQKHLDVGKHLLKLERESVYDEMKRKWAETCRSVGGGYVQIEPSTSSSTEQEPAAETPIIEMGWALKKTRKSVHFSEKVRCYLKDVFIQGEETGNKANAADVAARMKAMRNEHGARLFAKTEWLSAEQITRYFSRLSALNKSGRLQRDTAVVAPTAEEEEDEPYIAEAHTIRTRRQIRRELEL